MAATAPLGMPSGKYAHHPGWKPLQGSASDRIPGWAPSPCRLPGPVPRGTCKSPSGFHRRDRNNEHPSRAPEKVVRVNPFLARCAGQGVRAGCAGQFLPVSPATARAAAKQQPSSAATAHGQRSATARPENLCRARHVGQREEVLEDEIVHVRLDVDNPEARQHRGIGTAKTSVAAANSCCTGQHRRAATSARR